MTWDRPGIIGYYLVVMMQASNRPSCKRIFMRNLRYQMSWCSLESVLVVNDWFLIDH